MAIDAETAREQRRIAAAAPKPTTPATVRGMPVSTKTTTQTKKNVGSSSKAPTKDEIRALSNAYNEIKDLYESIVSGGGFDSGVSTTTVVEEKPEKTVVSTYVDPVTGDTIAVFSDGTTKVLSKGNKEQEKKDAFAAVEQTMRSYGFTETELNEILKYIQSGLTNPRLGPNQLIIELRNLPSYKARFAGNEARRTKGLNALSEAEYLAQERDYSETLRRYGQQRLANRNQFATLIGNDISNAELGTRVNIAVNRLQNANPAVLNQLRSYYPTITNPDIVAYFLSPTEVLPELESKVTTAEIGATAAQYGLASDLSRVSELQKYGVDLARARQGYENIAQILPRAEILSDIYKQSGIDYTQTTAEQEEFKGLASARRARNQLAQLETAAFSGASGLGKFSLTKQTGGTI